MKFTKSFFVLFSFLFFRDNAPGQRECDESLEQITYAINQLDQATLAAISNNLDPSAENSLQVMMNPSWFVL